MLTNDSQIHSYAIHCPHLGAELTEQALLSFSMSNIKDEALYEMFSLSACHTLFGGS